MIRLVGTACVRPLNATAVPGGGVLQVSDSQIYSECGQKLAGKIDRFSALAICGVNQLSPVLRQYSPEDVGLVIGTMLGGWGFALRELENLHRLGFQRVSAFQATAWFPAAPQGEVTILHGLRGYAKTLVGGLGCGLEALSIGFQALQAGHARAIVVGAVEAIDTEVSEQAYRWHSSASVLAEGAVFLVLERDSANGRAIDVAIASRVRTSAAIPDSDSTLSLAPLFAIVDAGKNTCEWHFEKGRQCLHVSLGSDER